MFFSLRLASLGIGLTSIAVLTAGMASSVRAQTLLHQYTFNGSVTDTVGTANGTLISGATAAGGTLTLDGIGSYVQFGSQIVPTSGSYSVTLFARQSAVQNGFIELISQGFSGGPGFYIGHDPNNIVRVSDSWLNTGVAFPSDTTTFHHYAVTVDTSVNKSFFYLDGTLRSTLNSAITTTTGGDNTRLGRQFSTITEFFSGQLRDVRVYSGALSAAQVTTLSAGSGAAPEPSALALLAPALPLLGWAVRRRRQKFGTV